MQYKMILSLALAIAFAVSFVSADYSLDIKLDQQSYSSGEDIKFSVILFEDNIPIDETLVVSFSDALRKKQVNQSVETNKESLFHIESIYNSGFWKVKTSYKNKSVERVFSIKEMEQVEFKIEKDKLIIKNNGNVPYAKEIQVMIGEEIISQKLNLKVGEIKEIRLIAPDGNYNIKVFDGENYQLSEQNIHLTGTGQVIGALDENLVGSSPMGGARDPGTEDKFFSSDKIPVAFVFVGAVIGLGILLFIERRLKKK